MNRNAVRSGDPAERIMTAFGRAQVTLRAPVEQLAGEFRRSGRVAVIANRAFHLFAKAYAAHRIRFDEYARYNRAIESYQPLKGHLNPTMRKQNQAQFLFAHACLALKKT